MKLASILKFYIIGPFTVLLGLLLLFSACEDSFIDPFDNDGRYFTIYGFIDELESNHAVRVIPVTRTPARIVSPTDAAANIDAMVSSTDMRTGQIIVWRHNLEELSDGTYGHIFRASFRPVPGTTYELTVERNDGIKTTATTKVPRLPITIPAPDTLFYPYEISPDSGWSQEVYLPDIASPWDIIVTYDLEGVRVRLPYGRPGERTEAGGWRFNIDMSADAPRIRQYFGISESQPLLLLHAIDLQVRVLDDNWDPPKGIFDPEVLAFPDELSNVENGYGLWGAVGLYQYTWIAPPQ